MTLTDQDRRDRIDATAGILTDLGLPTLAARLRDVIDELLPEPTPAASPSWEPTVGGWAEHREHGRVYVTAEIPRLGADSRWSVGIAGKSGGAWVDNHELSAPVPRTWSRAEDVPYGVLVADDQGVIFTPYEALRGISRGPWHEVGMQLIIEPAPGVAL